MSDYLQADVLGELDSLKGMFAAARLILYEKRIGFTPLWQCSLLHGMFLTSYNKEFDNSLFI